MLKVSYIQIQARHACLGLATDRLNTHAIFIFPFSQAHGVDLYINGHDHCLEQISSNDRSAQAQTNCNQTPRKVSLVFFPLVSEL